MSKSLRNAIDLNVGGNFKNRIINGDFSVKQRNPYNSTYLTNNHYFTDRFKSSSSSVDILGQGFSCSLGGIGEFENYNTQLDPSELVLCNTPSTNITENLITNGITLQTYDTVNYSNLGFMGDGISIVNGISNSGIYGINNGEFVDELSFGFWIRFIKPTFDAIDAFLNFGATVFEIGIGPDSHIYTAHSTDGSTWGWVKRNVKINSNEWYYFSGSLNRANNTIKVYINGVEFLDINNAVMQPFGNDSSLGAVVSGALTFGGRLDSSSVATINKDIRISHIRLFNRELSTSELRSLMFDSLTLKYKDNGFVFTHNNSNIDLKSASATLIKQHIESQYVDDLLDKQIATLSFDFKTNRLGKYAIVLKDSTLTNKKYYYFDVTNTSKNTYKVQIDFTGFANPLKQNETGVVVDIVSYDHSIPLLNNLAVLSVGDYFYINNIQLEEGSEATDFEYIPYDIQLMRCMRYYEICNMSYLYLYGGSNNYYGGRVAFHVQKRAIPTTIYTVIDGTGGSFYKEVTSKNHFEILWNKGSTGGITLIDNSTIYVDAEL